MTNFPLPPYVKQQCTLLNTLSLFCLFFYIAIVPIFQTFFVIFFVFFSSSPHIFLSKFIFLSKCLNDTLDLVELIKYLMNEKKMNAYLGDACQKEGNLNNYKTVLLSTSLRYAKKIIEIKIFCDLLITFKFGSRTQVYRLPTSFFFLDTYIYASNIY